MPRSVVILLLVLCVGAAAFGGWLAMPATPHAAPLLHGTWDAADPQLGPKAYVMCQACHAPDGRGVPGYAPSLVGSAWLNGDPTAASLIVLHGFDATTEPGSAYVSSRMLGHGAQLADHEIAGLLTWLRKSWGNQSPAVEMSIVTQARARFATRSQPWSPAELRVLSGGR
jgi:mono/diheme cytochrome c family protein